MRLRNEQEALLAAATLLIALGWGLWVIWHVLSLPG